MSRRRLLSKNMINLLVGYTPTEDPSHSFMSSAPKSSSSNTGYSLISSSNKSAWYLTMCAREELSWKSQNAFGNNWLTQTVAQEGPTEWEHMNSHSRFDLPISLLIVHKRSMRPHKAGLCDYRIFAASSTSISGQCCAGLSRCPVRDNKRISVFWKG